MRGNLRSILVLTLFAARAVHAQPADKNAAPAPAREKQKEQVLGLLEHARALARWMPNETSYLSVLDRVQEQVTAAREAELAPLSDFEPHLAHLTATLARMESRVSPLQSGVELCDPSKATDRFLLFLDALDADGQRQVQARICERIASEAGTEGSLSQVCVATDLALVVARAMHDLIVVCDPSLARADETGAKGVERLSSELAGVQAGVQQSVRSAKQELTQAMVMVADHVGEVSSTNAKQLEDLTVRLEIERALQEGAPYGSFYLPEANGGRLELVRTIVAETIQSVLESGEAANGAATKLEAGDAEFKLGHFKQAFRIYADAYRAAVGPASKAR
jgi:hypothetical protein